MDRNYKRPFPKLTLMAMNLVTGNMSPKAPSNAESGPRTRNRTELQERLLADYCFLRCRGLQPAHSPLTGQKRIQRIREKERLRLENSDEKFVAPDGNVPPARID